MRLRFLSYLALALGLSSCNLLSGRCTYEIRSLDGAGSASNGGSEVATAEIIFSETRGSLQNQSLQWTVRSATIAGHVRAVSFRDAADLSRVVVDLPSFSPAGSDVSQGTVDSRMGANLGGVRAILAAGRGVIEVQTDLASLPAIQIPITATNNGDWIRPYCS